MPILKWAAVAAGAILVLLLIAVGALLVFVSSDKFKSILAERAGSATGRDIEIAGDVDIDWGRTTRVTLNQLRVGNADWGSEPLMAAAERAEFTVRLPALLRGDVVLPEVVLIRPAVLLERNQEGKTNWDFSQNPDAAAAAEAISPDDRSEFPIIGRLVVRDGRVTYRDPAHGIDLASRVDTATGANGDEEVRLNGEGTFEGKPFRLDLTAGSLLQLRESSQPYPIRFETVIGDTKGLLQGTMVDPVEMQGLDIRMDISGPDLAQLFPIVGIPLPSTPPYRLAGHLEREGDRWRFTEMKGGVGDSDLSGDLALDTGGERPKLTADLVSTKLDFDDLAGLVGATPSTKPGEAASEEQKQKAEEQKESGRVLPDRKVDLSRLRAMDMTVSLVGKDVIAPSLPMQDFKAKFQLENGRLVVEPLSFGIASGRIEGRLVLNGREEIPSAATDLRIRSIKLAEFFRGSEFAEEMGGTFGGRIELDGTGRSTAELLGNSNGGAVIVMSGGKLSNLLLEIVGIDIAEALGFVIGDDKPVAVRCAVADFKVKDGLLKAQTFVIDTTDTNVTGEGDINLKNEKMDLKLEAHPKDPSLLSARTPVLIGGRLADPEFGVDPSKAIARGAAAALLGALLTPLAALLPMIELGLGEDSPCHKLIAEAQTSN
ncbi:MAG TPA: AsmA family protein [Alphaproteobacteria bacterium]